MIFTEVKFMEEKEEKQEYAPRPAWQVWGARAAALIFAGLIVLQIVSIARGGL